LTRHARAISTLVCVFFALALAVACGPRSQQEAIAMAKTAYQKDRCKGVLARLGQARKMSREPLDLTSRQIEVECSERIEAPEAFERKLAAVCQDFDWTRDGTALAVIKRAAIYPTGHNKRQTDGFVRFGIEIDDEGHVSDARVLESQPRGAFDSVARKAIEEWRYCPLRYMPPDTRWPETALLKLRHSGR
jgi:TonB family protein